MKMVAGSTYKTRKLVPEGDENVHLQYGPGFLYSHILRELPKKLAKKLHRDINRYLQGTCISCGLIGRHKIWCSGPKEVEKGEKQC